MLFSLSANIKQIKLACSARYLREEKCFKWVGHGGVDWCNSKEMGPTLKLGLGRWDCRDAVEPENEQMM